MKHEIIIIGRSSVFLSQIKKIRDQYEHQLYESHIWLWKSNLDFF